MNQTFNKGDLVILKENYGVATRGMIGEVYCPHKSAIYVGVRFKGWGNGHSLHQDDNETSPQLPPGSKEGYWIEISWLIKI